MSEGRSALLELGQFDGRRGVVDDRYELARHVLLGHSSTPVCDVRVDQRPDPRIEKPTDAVIRLSATCVCGSDLWPYRGIEKVDEPSPMGHEYVGIVEQVGADVQNVQPGQVVVGSGRRDR
jgi:Zn-dependent alcohol dehydrogenase